MKAHGYIVYRPAFVPREIPAESRWRLELFVWKVRLTALFRVALLIAFALVALEGWMLVRRAAEEAGPANAPAVTHIAPPEIGMAPGK